MFIYSEDKVHNPVRRKDSKLKRAVTFFKHFRRKTSHAEHHMPPLQYPKNQELDDSSREELDSSFSPELDGELCQELSACPPHPPRERSYLRPEMSRQSLSNYHSIGRLDGYYSSSELGTAGDSPDSSMSALHVQNYSLAHTKIALNIPTPWPSPIELLSTEPSTNNQGSYTHHLDISSSSRAAIELDASMCVDLVEADHGIPMSKPPIQATSCGSSELSKVPPHLVEASNDFRSKQYPSPQSLVQELRDCVEIYANHWSNILKLQLDTMEFSLYTTDTLFKTGHQTLKQVYEGVLPHTFEEVYSMMHIVYASVSILHHDDASFSWDLLFQHVIRWHRAIIDNAKSDLFLKVAGILWSPPEFLKSLNLVYCDLYSPATLPLMTGIQVSKSKSSLSYFCYRIAIGTLCCTSLILLMVKFLN